MTMKNNMNKFCISVCVACCSVLMFGTAVAHADTIKIIADNELPATIAATHGKLVLHLSSFDSNCGPCVKSNPALDELAKEFAGKATFFRVVTKPWDTSGPEMTKLKVMALPSVFLYQDGKLVQKYAGTGLTGKAPLLSKLAE